MNTTVIDNCSTGKNTLISKRVIVKFIYVMIYLSIYIINYRRVNAEFNKKQEEKEKEKTEVDEVLGLIRPVDEVTVASANEIVDEVEDDMETLYINDFEGTGEQLRRLRAYNPKNDGETDEDYTSRIWTMAYQEDEEEAKQKVANEVVVVSSNAVEEEIVPVANEVVEPLEKDINTWYKFEDGKGRYKGEWKNGMPNGKGIKHCYKTDSYIYGNFVDGFSEGYGKQTFEQTWEKTQPYYEGEFKRNNYHGKGEYHYGDGDYYKGMWKHNKYHGQGAAYSKRLNKTWVGEYCNDEKVEGNWVKGEI
jgi:hypothetical protein